MNTELTAKQIARIERIRAERAAKKSGPKCEYCKSVLPQDKMYFEYKMEDDDTFLCCGKCADDDENDLSDVSLVAVWKFGTSIEVEDPEEFDISDYKDYMFRDQDDEESVDNRECCENCHEKTSREEWTDWMGNDILYCDDCYERHRVGIERKCKECHFRQSFPNNDLCNICEPHECESEEEYEYEPGEKEYIEAFKNEDFDEMIRLFNLKKNKLI